MLPLRTARLTIRTMTVDDAAAHAAYRNDPEVARYQLWDLPFTVEQAVESLADQKVDGQIVHGDWTTMAVELDGIVIGDVVCHVDTHGAIAEIGYTLARAQHGHGYATEAASALVDELFDHVGVHRIVGELDGDNVASMRVLEAIGLEFEVVTKQSFLWRGAWADNMHYAVTRDDYRRWQERPRRAPGDVRLVEIRPDDAHLWGRLRTHHSQQRFISTMALSFRDALFPEVVDGAPAVPWMRGVEADGVRVAFVMLSEVTAHHPLPFLWRLLVDREHQRRGIGQRVVALVADRLRAEGHARLQTSYVAGLPGSPDGFYHRLGFVPTGDELDGETVADLLL